jgi:lysozyme family protein
MNSNLKTILINDLIDNKEGGFVNNKKDSGGATKYGITEAVARANGYTGNMKDLPRELAVSIYEKEYWKPLNLDLIAIISPMVAEELFDTSVNCGIGTAAQWFQLVLNAFNRQGIYYPDLIVDGKVGKFTVNCFKDYMNHRAHLRGEKVMLKALNCLQGAHYIKLAALREKDKEFVYGQIDKRVEL